MKYLKYSVIILLMATISSVFVSNAYSTEFLVITRDLKGGESDYSLPRTKNVTGQQVAKIISASVDGCVFSLSPGEVDSSGNVGQPIYYDKNLTPGNTYKLSAGYGAGNYSLWIKRTDFSLIKRNVGVNWDPNDRYIKNQS